MGAIIPAMTPAGFWIRALALVVDFVIFSIAQLGLGFLGALLWGVGIEDRWGFQGTLALFTLVFTAAYTTVLHAALGQTIGKSLVGVRVVGTDGRLLTVGAALLRYLGYYLSFFTFTLGFIMAGLRSDKRALHDLLAGSRVERLPRAARVTTPIESAAPGESDVLGVPVTPVAVPTPGGAAVSDDRPEARDAALPRDTGDRPLS